MEVCLLTYLIPKDKPKAFHLQTPWVQSKQKLEFLEHELIFQSDNGS